MSGGPRDIVDAIDDLDGSDYSDPNELEEEAQEEEGEEGESGDDDAPLAADADLEEELSRPAKQKKDKPETEAQKQRKVKATNDPKKDKGEIRLRADGTHVDAQGNIVDPRDGTIIARAGSERRWYERHARAEAQVSQVQKENVALKTQMETHQWLNGVPQRFGLQEEEVQNALALAAVYKQNPVEAARELVEMALAQGHNVSDILGKDAGNALEMGAVRQMIEERLAPLVTTHKQTEQQTERQRNAEMQLQKFIVDHEHSDLHITVLDRMIGDNPELSPEKAYYELKLFCAQKGFDFSRPLQPQLQEAMQRANGPAPAQPPRRGLPNGRTASMSQREVGDTLQVEPATSWSDIIKSSM